MVIAVGGGWLLLRWTGNLTLVYAALGRGLATFGIDDRASRSRAARGFAAAE